MSADNRVLETTLTVISEDPLVAELHIQTPNGSHDLAINEQVAQGWIDMLVKFVTKEAPRS